MNLTLIRPAATLSQRMGEELGVRARLRFRGSLRLVCGGEFSS